MVVAEKADDTYGEVATGFLPQPSAKGRDADVGFDAAGGEDMAEVAVGYVVRLWRMSLPPTLARAKYLPFAGP